VLYQAVRAVSKKIGGYRSTGVAVGGKNPSK
jgi:hypothetical protein